MYWVIRLGKRICESVSVCYERLAGRVLVSVCLLVGLGSLGCRWLTDGGLGEAQLGEGLQDGGHDALVGAVQRAVHVEDSDVEVGKGHGDVSVILTDEPIASGRANIKI